MIGESAFNHSVIGLISQCCQDFWKRFGCQSLVDGHARGCWLALMLTHAREVQLCHVGNGTRSACLDPLCHKVFYAQVREEAQPAIYSTSCGHKFSQNGVSASHEYVKLMGDALHTHFPEGGMVMFVPFII